MKKRMYDYLTDMEMDEFLEQLDDFRNGYYYIHEAAKRIRQLQEEVRQSEHPADS